MSAPPTPLVSGVTQIALASADPAKLAGFYRAALGLEVLFEAGGMIFMDGGGVRLMIGPKDEPVEPGDTALYFEPKIWSIAESAVETAGGAFMHPAIPLQKADGRELMLRAFKDPEGHTLALLGWRAV